MIPDIDVRSLLAKKIYVGTLVFEYEPEEDILDIPYTKFSSPVKAELRYEIFEDNSVEVKGSITFSLKGACSRCLEPAEKCYTEEVEALFETPEGDGETYGYQHVVKLNEFLRDALLFALPSRLLCGNCGDPDGE
ncbi:MAG: hypothetical protein IKD43_00035 [Clostridia bacterium]|nr:hypothetical protein [Clostridia bacterium]